MAHESETDRIRREFAQRLNQALDKMGFAAKHAGRQIRLAKEMRRSQKGVRRWLEGEGMPRPKDLEKLAKFVGVRREWLVFGLGPMNEIAGQGEEFDRIFMQRIMVAISTGLESAKIRATEPQKAQLVTVIYESLRH